MVRILVVGAGRVGAPLAAWLSTKLDDVESVTAVDNNPQVCAWMRDGTFPWPEPGLNEAILDGRENNKLFVVEDFSSIEDASPFDMAFVCVGTPVSDSGEPQIGHVMQIVRTLKDTQIIIRSTVPPGTCDKMSTVLGRPVIHAPERLLLGNGMAELDGLPQIVGSTHLTGSLDEQHNIAIKFLIDTFPSVVLGTAVEAELAKICNNTVRYVEFALGTELSLLMGYAGADCHKVRKMMTEGYGRGRLAFPSFVSSYCLTKDWQMLQHQGLESSFAIAAYDFNQNLFKRLGARDLHHANNVGVLGLTYKPGQDDTRSSLTWDLLKWLKSEGVTGTLVHDPLIKLTAEQELEHGAYSVACLSDLLEVCDLIFVMTAHDEYAQIRPRADTVFIDPAGIVPVGNHSDFVRSVED